MRHYFRRVLFLSASLLFACSESSSPPPADLEANFVGSKACRDCHQTQYSDWTDSHHDLAMQLANQSTVLGDFDDLRFDYFGDETRFQRAADDFIVRTQDSDGGSQDFRIAYTFGVTPLQQYLVEFADGRLQTLPFAWDSRSRQQGGQRWFHLYADEKIGPEDPLHWLGRQQNWNSMCAECHSTNLAVNFDLAADTFATRWSEIDVGCESCHGPGSAHIAQAQSGALRSGGGFPVNLDDHGRATWQMNVQTGIAERSELPMRPPQQPESCGRCHARRGILSTDYEYGRPLEDTHRLSLLDAPLYYDDGQIRDEVYVYGSFVQSKMYQAGVTCSDCHSPHSLKLIAGDRPSDVCSQCHLPSKFATTEHHEHDNAVIACVDCHMPESVYMSVDPRRDHSFRVPRPALTLATASPNACNSCHSDRDAQWAADAAHNWWGDDGTSASHFAHALHNARKQFANVELLEVVNNGDVPGIARATALTLLASPFGQSENLAVERATRDGNSLVRRAAVQAVRNMRSESQITVAAPLLKDPVRSVRIEAAVLLAPLQDYLPMPAAFTAAANEFRAAQQATDSRPEAHAALGSFAAAVGKFEQAFAHFAQSLRMQPSFASARINFADVARSIGDEALAESVLRDGLLLDEQSASLRHALGLLLVRTQRNDEGLLELQAAARLAPEISRYTYVVAIALSSLGKQSQAIDVLQSAKDRFVGDFDIAWALATILRDRGETDRARAVAEQLAHWYPDNPNVMALLESFSAS